MLHSGFEHMNVARRHGCVFAAICVCVLALFYGRIAQAAQHALVIGNASYASQDVLRNPVADARLVGEALRASGFVVQELSNADQLTMLAALATFRQRAAGAELALIYYSGHGMKHGGEQQNYLLPVDMPSTAANAALNPDILLQSKAIAESALLDALGGATFQVLILDACRDNVTGTKSGNKGLSRRSGVGSGRLVAYATEENSVARDGAGRNSPYAQSLARAITGPKRSVVQILDAVAADVRAQTAGAQSPTKTGDLAWNIGLDGRPIANASGNAIQPTVDEEGDAWATAQQVNTVAGYDSFLGRFREGRFAPNARMARSLLLAPERSSAASPAAPPTPKVSASDAGRMRLAARFDFQGPLGRSDRTLLAFDAADQHLLVVGVADGANARSPIEVRALATPDRALVRTAAERMFWQTAATLVDQTRGARVMSSTWGAVSDFTLVSSELAPKQVRLDPRLSSNGAAALNAAGDAVVVNQPCVAGKGAEPVAGALIERAGRWLVSTGKCASSIRLMVDQPHNPVLQYFAVDASAQWLAYRYRYGSGDLFVQHHAARVAADIKRLPVTDAPADSSGRREYESVTMSPGAMWIASWTRYGPRAVPQASVPLFSVKGPQKVTLSVPGRRTHGVIFASDDRVLTLSDTGDDVAPLVITMFEAATGRALDQVRVTQVANVHGVAVSASGKRLALALHSGAEPKIVNVLVLDLL